MVYDQDTYTALSSPCLRHSANHRTIAAQLVLNSRYFDSFNEQSKLKWLGTVVHELTHILGFSKNSFKLYGLLHRHKDGSHYLNAKELVEEGRVLVSIILSIILAVLILTTFHSKTTVWSALRILIGSAKPSATS